MMLSVGVEGKNGDIFEHNLGKALNREQQSKQHGTSGWCTLRDTCGSKRSCIYDGVGSKIVPYFSRVTFGTGE